MLIDVVPIVRQVLPGLLTDPRPSVACVRTTREKYLVFDGNAARPACVVELGEEARLRHIDNIQVRLSARCPGAVAKPLACTAWGRGHVVHIQEGLAGLPWFRLFDTLRSVGDWEALLERAAAVMHRLHDAVRGVPEWVGTIDLRSALARQVSTWQASAPGLDFSVRRGLNRCLMSLEGLAPMTAVAQHGDFSLNNLMVAPDSLAVIDFEEFGLTRMPLHDAIGLALSFPLSQDGRCPIPLPECVERAIGGSAVVRSLDEGVMRGLILHHLLLRINESNGQPSRARLRATLTTMAERVARDSGNGLASLTLAAR
jgi:hypothetical protein